MDLTSALILVYDKMLVSCDSQSLGITLYSMKKGGQTFLVPHDYVLSVLAYLMEFEREGRIVIEERTNKFVAFRRATSMDKLIQPTSKIDPPACDICGSITIGLKDFWKCLSCGHSMART